MPDRNDNRELLTVLDRVERMFHNLEVSVGRLRDTVEHSIAHLEQSITHLVRTIEQDDQLRERAERAEQRERDDNHDQLLELLREDLIPRIENVAKNMRGLPAAVLDHTERKVYELRTARWELTRASGVTEAELLDQGRLPAHREPSTGRIAVARRDVTDETTGVFDLKHTDGEKRAIKQFVGGIALHLWDRGGKWFVAIGGGAGAWHALLKLLEFLRH